jgi:hypothetical protein
MAEVNAEALRRGAASARDGTQPSHLPNIFEAFPWVEKDNIWRDAFARGFCLSMARLKAHPQARQSRLIVKLANVFQYDYDCARSRGCGRLISGEAVAISGMKKDG